MKSEEEIRQFLEEQTQHPIEIEPARKYQQWFCLALKWVLDEEQTIAE